MTAKIKTDKSWKNRVIVIVCVVGIVVGLGSVSRSIGCFNGTTEELKQTPKNKFPPGGGSPFSGEANN